MKNKNFPSVIFTLVLGLILVAGIVWVNYREEQGVDEVRLQTPVTEGEWVVGDAEAPVTIVLYSDFECPSCKIARDTMSALLADQKGNVKFVYRHMPLSQIHTNAQKAAEAAEAAGAQGKFFEMHDIIFENQDKLSLDDLKRYAEEIEVSDLDRFKRELDEGVYAEKVEEDRESGLDSGVTGVPTYYINDVRFDGTHSVANFRQEIQDRL